jgi:hypothetical protein
MLGIAYGTLFEVEQFGLFHVSMHIGDTTTETLTRKVGPWLLSCPKILT